VENGVKMQYFLRKMMEMGDGRWEMGDGRWKMGDGRWEIWEMGIIERRCSRGMEGVCAQYCLSITSFLYTQESSPSSHHNDQYLSLF
jgi:hypothetical protein